MKLRHLRITIQTTGGPFQTDIPFSDGLVVIRAKNTRGKSTCFQSILTALGFEAILTTSQSELPLNPAVQHRLEWEDAFYDVTESDVYLEIQNEPGERITIRRTIRGERDWHLVTVYDGAALTSPGEYEARDYYVSRSGGASRDAGFHKELARFLGWNLPNVATYEDKECLLYLQMIFPFIFVEQKRGWGSIAPPIPTQWRIREPHRRVVEFLLMLDAYQIAIRRQQLKAQRSQIQSRWNTLVDRAEGIANIIHGQVRSLPIAPTSQWPPQVSPSIVVPVGDNWFPHRDLLLGRKQERNRLVHEEIPKVKEIADTAESELSQMEITLRSKEVLLARLLNTLQLENEEVEATKQRLATIKEDLIRNKDARTLRDLGSKRLIDLNEGQCPVCHQAIQDSLVPVESKQSIMSLDENIAFLEEQRKTFELVLGEAERVSAARERQVIAIRREVSEYRGNIRSLRQTLISDGRLPSEAAIRARIELERAIEQDLAIEQKFNEVLEEISEVSKEWALVESALAMLPKEDVSDADILKIRKLTDLLRQQLEQYKFESFPAHEVNISTDSYLPEHDGFNLQASISASDLIRTIWAYLIGMLEIARTVKTNHPGLLVFDEPRQQSADRVSFGELVKRAATSGKFGQQVIVFTSEDASTVRKSLEGLPHSLTDFDNERLIKPKSQ